MVGMVVVWIVPRPGSRCLSSVARSGECQRWSDVEVWYPNNYVSAQSVVAINVCCLWWISQIWQLLVASLPPMGHLPLGSGCCSDPHDITTRGVVRVRMPPLETAWSLSQILWWYLSGYLHIWRPLVQVRLNKKNQESTFTRLAWKEPLLTRVVQNICKTKLLCGINTCHCIKRAYPYSESISFSAKYIMKAFLL